MSPEEKEQQELNQLLDAQYPVDEAELGKTWWQKAADDGYTPLAFDSAFDLLAWSDTNIQEGATTIYPWQLETLEFLSRNEYTKDNPIHFNLCAVNGSGKDAYVIAPFAVFHCACKVRSRFHYYLSHPLNSLTHKLKVTSLPM
jgi:hypothetical protein